MSKLKILYEAWRRANYEDGITYEQWIEILDKAFLEVFPDEDFNE